MKLRLRNWRFSTVLEAALAYAARGWRIFPSHYPIGNDGCSCGRSPCNSPGKHPRTPNGYKDATGERQALEDWFTSDPAPNISIATGEVSGIIVLDVDKRHGGLESLERMGSEYGPLPKTPTAQTGGGGLHIYFKYPVGKEIRTRPKIGEYAGIELKSNGASITAPPSKHSSGKAYKWITSAGTTLAELPEWLIEIAVGHDPRAATAIEPNFDGDVTAGHRNSHLTSIAGAVLRKGASLESVKELLLVENNKRCHPPLERNEVLGIAKSIARYRKPLKIDACANESEDDPHRLSRACIPHFSNRRGLATLRFHGGEWWLWNGKCYEPLAVPMLRAMLMPILKDAVDVAHSEYLQSAHAAEKKATRRKTRVTRALADDVAAVMTSQLLVQKAQPCWLEIDHPWPAAEVLACRNGLVRLDPKRSDKVRVKPLTPLFFSSNAVPYDFDSTARCPEWKRFLRSVWQDDQESIALLQEWTGYLLLPDTRQQKILMIVGPRRSGKGTINSVLTGLLGPANVAGLSLSSLSGSFGMQPLLKKLLATVSDARLSLKADGAGIIENLLRISGEDPIDVHRKYLPAVTQRLTVRLMILANELPHLPDMSGAFATRLLILPMTRSFLGVEDVHLRDRLFEELPGILNWAIVGWRRLIKRGRFRQPKSGEEMIEGLKRLGSPIHAFLDDKCIEGQTFEVSVDALFRAWHSWSSQTGRTFSGTKETFAKNLRAAIPALKLVRHNGVRYYQGLSLKPNKPR
jgi:putative DNA primase/helicase